MTSTRTTSPSSFSTAYWATEAPTLPAPTTVILGRPASNVPSLAYRLATEAGGWITDSPRLRLRRALRPRDVLRLALQLRHVLDDGGAELRALHFFRALHEAREVVGDHPGLDRLLQRTDHQVRGVRPAHVAQHHFTGKNDRSWIDLVLPRVLRRGPVRRLEERVPGLVVDVRAGGDPDPAHLGGERVRQEVPREVRGGDHVELVRPREDLLEERVGDRVLDEDPARGGLAGAVVPAHGPVTELPLGQRVPPLHEHAFRVLLNVPLLAKRHVERAEPLTDGRRERTLDGDEKLADDVEGFVGEEVGRAVAAVDRLGLLASEHLGPRDLLPPPVGLLHGGVQHAHGRAPDVGAGAVALDERDDRVVRDAELPVVDRDLVAPRNLDAPRHYVRSPWAAFSADPPLNHVMCSSVRLWSASIVSVRPSGFLIVTVTGLPGASVARPVTLTRSCGPKRS